MSTKWAGCVVAGAVDIYNHDLRGCAGAASERARCSGGWGAGSAFHAPGGSACGGCPAHGDASARIGVP